MNRSRNVFLSILMAFMMAMTSMFPIDASEKAQPTAATDFYQYVNSQWLEENEISNTRSVINNFTQVNERTEKIIKSILRNLDKNYEKLRKGSDEKKLIDFYRMALDFETRNKLGLQPIKKYTDIARAPKNIEEFDEAMKELFSYGFSTVVSMGPFADKKDSDRTVLYILIPSVAMERAYFEGRDRFSLRQQKAYKRLITDLFMLNGDVESEARKKANLVFEFEKELVSSFLTIEEENNGRIGYYPMSLQQLKNLAPNIDYAGILEFIGVPEPTKVVVMQPKALEKMNNMYHEANLPALKAQMEFRILLDSAVYLSKDTIKALVRYTSVSTGINEIPSDQQLAYEVTNSVMGDILGKLYVEQAFSSQNKKDVERIAKDILQEYRKHLTKVDWMSEKTKVKALKKLDTMVLKIGYPDKWDDYSQVDIKSSSEGGTLISNVEKMAEFGEQQAIASIDRKTDRTVWHMNPQEINAYYSPQNNEIVFSAAILQPPFYDPKASKEENLGGIGMIIGHEVSHAFDHIGAQYDEKGNLTNWWTEEDKASFQKKVQRAADIYSSIEVIPGYRINGEVSAGEVIADLGGLSMAIAVAQEKGYDTKKVFESYAKVWREKSTKESLIYNLLDSHPPGKYRINNIVNLIDQFYIDFDVKPGDPMYLPPDERLRVWQ